MYPLAHARRSSPVRLPGRSGSVSATLPLDGAIPPEMLGDGPAEPSRPSRLGMVVLLVWTAIALCQAAQYYFFPDPDDGPVTGPRALGLGFGLWYTWGLLGLIAFRLSRRFSPERNRWPNWLALHMASCLGFAAVKIFIDYPIIKGLYCPRPDDLTFPVFVRMGFSGPFLRFILYYWALIAVSHALDYYGKYREGQLRAAQLEAGLTRARLHLLKTQLQPHFLFNTLNAISALLHVDADAADRMLARLGDLLHLALEDFAVQEAPLTRELEIARSYLEIEQGRLGPRLIVDWNIAAEACDAWVPTFLLQPLIENAVRHGIAARIEPGCIEIHARRKGAELHLEVRDDGPGLLPGGEESGGVGLANTRARLRHLYGTAQRLELANLPRGGCVARIVLPFREPAGESSSTTKVNHDSHANC
jgi:two-component system, LytTR family, sensor kinase